MVRRERVGCTSWRQKVGCCRVKGKKGYEPVYIERSNTCKVSISLAGTGARTGGILDGWTAGTVLLAAGGQERGWLNSARAPHLYFGSMHLRPIGAFSVQPSNCKMKLRIINSFSCLHHGSGHYCGKKRT